jgi:hypothetical protein
MADDGRGSKAAECTAPGGRNVLAVLGQPLDVGLIDDRVFPRDRWSAFFPPGEGLVDDDALGHPARVVPSIERQVGPCAAGAIAEMGIAPDEAPGQVPGVGVDEELMGVEAEPAFGLIAAVNAVTIELSRPDIVQVAVPDILSSLRQGDAFDFAAAVAIEEAELDLRCIR